MRGWANEKEKVALPNGSRFSLIGGVFGVFIRTQKFLLMTTEVPGESANQ